MSDDGQGKERLKGYAYALAAFAAWGFLPIYWKLLSDAQPLEILAHRIVWSFIFVVIVLIFRKNAKLRKVLRSRRNVVLLILMGVLVGSNWLIYIFAVNSDRIIEASMGYYINPLLSIFLGIVFLRERLDKLQIAAFCLAVIGVLYITIDYGRFPWIAVSLATLFGIYGLLKKLSDVDPMQSLGIETLVLSPLALGWIVFIEGSGGGHLLSSGLLVTLLLLFAGVVTTLPLYWFAEGAKRIPLSSVGFMQYIAPSLMLVIGRFLYHEAFTTAHWISFGLIWTGLSLYTFSLVRNARSKGPDRTRPDGA